MCMKSIPLWMRVGTWQWVASTHRLPKTPIVITATISATKKARSANHSTTFVSGLILLIARGFSHWNSSKGRDVRDLASGTSPVSGSWSKTPSLTSANCTSNQSSSTSTEATSSRTGDISTISFPLTTSISKNLGGSSQTSYPTVSGWKSELWHWWQGIEDLGSKSII